LELCADLVEAAKRAGVANVCLVSSAGCEYADPRRQPRLREFIDLENLVLSAKGDAGTETGGSPCVIRAGFYAENLLLYAPQAKEEGLLPLPIGESHKFAPVALGVSSVLAQKKEKNKKNKIQYADEPRLGPKLCAGHELAAAASKALGTEMKFENISQAEAKRVLKAQSDSDQSELQFLLEYYALVREGKTNYIATTAFRDVTGTQPTEPDEFFRLYQSEMRPSKKAKHAHNHK
ncbi:hypothetical protein E4U41_004302, partial [Claviceps citrina]